MDGRRSSGLMSNVVALAMSSALKNEDVKGGEDTGDKLPLVVSGAEASQNDVTNDTAVAVSSENKVPATFAAEIDASNNEMASGAAQSPLPLASAASRLRKSAKLVASLSNGHRGEGTSEGLASNGVAAELRPLSELQSDP